MSETRAKYRVLKVAPLNRGFTLIELLVVIAIIMILAGMLLPVFSSARARGRQTSCMSNLRQCGMAFKMYFTDNEERFPPQNIQGLDGYSTASPRQLTGDDMLIWVGQIDEYIRSQGVVRCISIKEPAIDKLNGTFYGLGYNMDLSGSVETVSDG